VDARDLLQRLAVRWPLVLTGFVVSALIGAAVFLVTPTNYTSAAGVLVVPPTTDGGSTPVNPLSSLDSVVQVASTLVYTAQTAGAAGQISDASDGGSASAVNTGSDPSLNTPYIQITSTGNSADDATNAAQAAIKVMSTQLANIQNTSGVPTYLKMRLAVMAQPVTATASGSARLKAGGLGAAVAFVIALVMVAVFDRMLLSRQPKGPPPPPPPRPRKGRTVAEPEGMNETTTVIERGAIVGPGGLRGSTRR
jgi:capsular polysaccharide biosynthesis protein